MNFANSRGWRFLYSTTTSWIVLTSTTVGVGVAVVIQCCQVPGLSEYRFLMRLDMTGGERKNGFVLASMRRAEKVDISLST